MIALLLAAALTLNPAQQATISRIGMQLSPTAKMKLQQIGRNMANAPNVIADPPGEAKRAIVSAFPGARMNDAQMNMLTVIVLSQALDSLKTQLDSKGDMSEMTSLRLQMAMDRRSKFIETLSNILKKISNTDDAIVKNLK